MLRPYVNLRVAGESNRGLVVSQGCNIHASSLHSSSKLCFIDNRGAELAVGIVFEENGHDSTSMTRKRRLMIHPHSLGAALAVESGIAVG
jgi:hypothetical protein